jgi:hypothetical protein
MSSVHRSPSSDTGRAIEQGSCCRSWYGMDKP